MLLPASQSFRRPRAGAALIGAAAIGAALIGASIAVQVQLEEFSRPRRVRQLALALEPDQVQHLARTRCARLIKKRDVRYCKRAGRDAPAAGAVAAWRLAAPRQPPFALPVRPSP